MNARTLLALLSSLLLLTMAACSEGAANFAGKFRGDGLTVELRAAADGYTGTLTLQGKSFDATARRQGEELTGEFSDGTGKFPFTVAGSGEGLRFVTGGTTYALQRQAAVNPLARNEPANPLAKKPENPTPDTPGPTEDAAGRGDAVDPSIAREIEAKTAAAEQTLAAAPSFTKTYKHPAGIYFMHPDRWTVSPVSDGAVSLDPDDLYSVKGERAELMIVVGEEAAGVQRVDHPDITRLVEGFVRESFPYLRRQGSPKTMQIGAHKALAVRWSGVVSDLQMEAAMHVALLGGYALGTFTLAPKDRFAARHQTMTDVFRTFGYDKPKGDPRLVGSWRYSKTYISGTFSTVTIRNLVLQADGTCLEGGKMFAGMDHHDSGGDFTGSTTGQGGGAEYRGRWHVEGKDIVFEWSGGTAERWGFYIEGDSMLWKDGKSRKLWERVR